MKGLGQVQRGGGRDPSSGLRLLQQLPAPGGAAMSQEPPTSQDPSPSRAGRARAGLCWHSALWRFRGGRQHPQVRV